MEIFKELNKLGYKHYVDLTIEELDNLPINNIKRKIEHSLVIDWFREEHNIYIDISGRLIDSKDKTFQWNVYGLFEEVPGELYSGLDKDFNMARIQSTERAIELIK